ncbi:hypothetical protein PV350_33840 [Streptomyces sp. PA03-6a]|nr:hypothetical protein [Streptomyces sp. PA03-6a]
MAERMTTDLTPAELLELAVDRERCAARCEAAALDGDRAAVDPGNSPMVRAQAKRAAEVARGHATEYREEAEEFRAGEVPERYWGLPYTG